jgi:hypothetical protein
LEGEEGSDGVTCEGSTDCAGAGSSNLVDHTRVLLSESTGVEKDWLSVPFGPAYAAKRHIREGEHQ